MVRWVHSRFDFQVGHSKWISNSFSYQYLFRWIRRWLKTKFKIPNFFVLIVVVAIQKEKMPITFFSNCKKQQKISKEINLVFHIWFLVTGWCDHDKISTQKMFIDKSYTYIGLNARRENQILTRLIYLFYDYVTFANSNKMQNAFGRFLYLSVGTCSKFCHFCTKDISTKKSV